MSQTNEKWWEETRRGAFRLVEDEHCCCIKPEDSIQYSEWLASEAERRGYERAMEEVRKAAIGTVRFTVDQGSEKEEDVDTWCIPKSFFA